MRVLIVENELYLAQSIAAKLNDLGYTCEFASTPKEAIRDEQFEIVLLSTNISDQNFAPVLKYYKKSIVILMVSYINEDTVTKPLKDGACDYILKPFMIEELIRKINHYQDYEKLKRRNTAYEKYLNHSFTNAMHDNSFTNIALPLFISSSFQKYADAFAFEYAQKKDIPINFLTLSDSKSLNEIKNIPQNSLIYVIDYQVLKKGDKKSFCELIVGRNIIISSTDKIEDIEHPILELENENNIFDKGEILPIEDYVKFIILNYQDKYPDTELSKKLGISRKSLWEKRKKYDIIKKK